MSYTINPNAKNKWARNAENTMDLSLETDASSVYLDNGRTLEQEIGKGTMVSNVVTIDSSMEKVVEGTYDGTYESCKMYGKSLVNLMTNCKDEYVVRYHDPSNPEYTVANISMMKPNTEYTLFYKAKYRLEGEGAGESGTLHIATSVEQGFIDTSQELTTEYKQYVFKFTTSDIVDCFTFKTNGNYFAIKECVLLEGDYTNQDVPFFEGLCDVKMPILRNVGKNLFDINVYPFVDKVAYQEGNRVSWSGYRGITELFPVKPNTTYTFSNDLNKPIYFGIVFYDNNKTKVSYGHAERTTFTTPDNCAFIRFSIQSDVSPSWVQIEESSQQTTYEDYKTSILTTPEEVILRKVGDVCDSYDALTGEYVQRIGEIVLDGSEDGWKVSVGSPTVNRPAFTNSSIMKDVVNINGSNYLTLKPLCNKYSSYSQAQLFNVVDSPTPVAKGIAYRWDGYGLGVRNDEFSYDNEGLELFKQSLTQDPITVLYELAEPITTIVEPSTIPFAYQNGHIILESGYEGQSLLPMLEYSTVVNKTGQIESVAKTIQRQEKQLTMLEKMLIQNIINLDYNNTLLTLKNEMEEML